MMCHNDTEVIATMEAMFTYIGVACFSQQHIITLRQTFEPASSCHSRSSLSREDWWEGLVKHIAAAVEASSYMSTAAIMAGWRKALTEMSVD